MTRRIVLTSCLPAVGGCNAPPAAPSPPAEAEPVEAAASVEVEPLTIQVGEFVNITYCLSAPLPYAVDIPREAASPAGETNEDTSTSQAERPSAASQVAYTHLTGGSQLGLIRFVSVRLAVPATGWLPCGRSEAASQQEKGCTSDRHPAPRSILRDEAGHSRPSTNALSKPINNRRVVDEKIRACFAGWSC